VVYVERFSNTDAIWPDGLTIWRIGLSHFHGGLWSWHDFSPQSIERRQLDGGCTRSK